MAALNAHLIKFRKSFSAILFIAGMAFLQPASSQVNLLSQGFESLPFPPTGWSNVRITGPSLPGNWGRIGNGVAPIQTPHTGSWQVRYNSHNYAAGTSGDLRTSVLDFTTAGSYVVSFWMYRDNWAANDKLEVFVNTTQTSVGGTLLGTINRDRNQSPNEGANGWFQYSFTIPPAFNTATNYVIFKGTSAFGNDIYMDDISIDRLPPAVPGCLGTFSPANGAVGECTNETLEWGIVATASGYKLSLGTNAPNYNNILNNVDLGVALSYTTSLPESTTYGWKVTPYNGFGDATGCGSNTFTTGTGVCYDTPVYLESSCSTEDYIDDFSTSGGAVNISNDNSGCSTNPNNFTFFSTKTVSATQGNSFTVNMQSGPDFAEGFAVYADWNKDGDFDDAGEYAFNSGTATTAIVSGIITVPYTATVGTTRLRVRCAYNYVPLAGQAVTTFNEGEAEDYNMQVNACAASTYYADADGDTYGNALSSISSCYLPVGYTANNTDCNDAVAYIHPGSSEICNGLDDDCVGGADDGLTFKDYYADADGDTYGNSAASPVNSCAAIPGYVVDNSDCNDANAAVYPGGTEVCNGIDDDCVGGADNGLLFLNYYIDADADAYGNATASPVSSCTPITAYVLNHTDCNDANGDVHPGATELCNGIDDDCAGGIDNGAATATITAGGPITFCKPGTVTLNANTGAGYNYQWMRNGGNIAGATTSAYTTNKSGSYQVKVTVPGGCLALSASTVVTVNPTPTATISTPDGTDLCGHVNVRLKAPAGAGFTYIWYKNNVVIAGATAGTYFATLAANYKVKVTNASGCFKTSPQTTIVKTCREDEALSTETSISIYPNPAANSATVYLNCPDSDGDASINCYDMMGNMVLNLNTAINNGIISESLDLTNLASGMYLVKIIACGQQFTQQITITK
jgi:hypothetical protein